MTKNKRDINKQENPQKLKYYIMLIRLLTTNYYSKIFIKTFFLDVINHLSKRLLAFSSFAKLERCSKESSKEGFVASFL